MNRKRYCTNELVESECDQLCLSVATTNKSLSKMEKEITLALGCFEYLILDKGIRLTDIPIEIRIWEPNLYRYAAKADKHKDISYINEDIDILKSDIGKLKKRSYLKPSLIKALKYLEYIKKSKIRFYIN